MKTKVKLLTLILLIGCINIGFAQKIDQAFFNDVDAFLKANVTDGLVDYGSLVNNNELSMLVKKASTARVSGLDANTKQAFYINAYNLNVIKQIVDNYPISSVQSIPGFFDKKKVMVANESITLNNLEKKKLLKVYKDARYHFVLVCGALGCPPITNFAYTPELLDQQLDQQTRIALNDPEFVQISDGKLALSEIFKWYTSDFGGSSKSVIKFINKYRDARILPAARYKYYDYDWTINDTAKKIGGSTSIGQSSNESRYIVSSTIPKGSVELKVFNNLYSQKTGNEELTDRSSFFTTSISAFYGLTNNFNVGLNTRVRKVRNQSLPSSPFEVFGSDENGSSRSGFTAFGPQIRYAPVPKWKNFSIQSSFLFALGDDLTGTATEPFIDWNGHQWNTQFFNDFSIGSKFSLFTELDFLIEDIGDSEEGHINRVSTPVTAIFSYVPTNKLTLYFLSSYSPYWQENFDYFAQYGVGSKYQFTPSFEIELLYTDFTNKFLSDTGGQAQTINLGLRANF